MITDNTLGLIIQQNIAEVFKDDQQFFKNPGGLAAFDKMALKYITMLKSKSFFDLIEERIRLEKLDKESL